VGIRDSTALFFNALDTHSLKILYSTSILENFHVSIALCLMQTKNCDIMADMAPANRAKFRSLMTELVLDTDMSQHFDRVLEFKTKREAGELEDTSTCLNLILRFIIKVSDIGHSVKSWERHLEWSYLVQAEFFAQGDLERNLGLPIGPVCDRKVVNFCKGQNGFLNFLVAPLMEEFCSYVEKKEDARAELCVSTLRRYKSNAQNWLEHKIKEGWPPAPQTASPFANLQRSYEIPVRHTQLLQNAARNEITNAVRRGEATPAGSKGPPAT
jgi:hypothetical protein